MGQLERKTKQTYDPFASGAENLLYQAVIQSSESSKTELLSWSMMNWIPRGWRPSASKESMYLQEEPPSHLAIHLDEKRAVPTRALYDDSPRNTPFLFLSRRPICTEKQEEAGRSVKAMEKWHYKCRLASLMFWGLKKKNQMVIEIVSSFKNYYKVKTWFYMYLILTDVFKKNGRHKVNTLFLIVGNATV